MLPHPHTEVSLPPNVCLTVFLLL